MMTIPNEPAPADTAMTTPEPLHATLPGPPFRRGGARRRLRRPVSRAAQVALHSAVVCVLFASTAFSDDKPDSTKPEAPKPVKHQITGLFSKDRIDDLKETMKSIPEIALVEVDFASAEASFVYDAPKVFPGAKPEQIVERFDNMLKQASRHTFGVKPLRTLPMDKLKLIEIPIGGLDCKGCCLGAYDAIYRLPGVERATASFRDGIATALIDPEKTDRTELEMALKQRGVEIKTP